MKPKNPNDLFEVANALYYEMNPNTKMNVPNGAYIMTEQWLVEWENSNSKLDLYDWIHENKKPKKQI
ncbi:hypothetical protein UFOVP690_37 [uncultured Caudovirales phage]|uniref:Uncharacterized protein n=1 Tax=uncultured Caudovirales phage TaxID=2100421 RepID=A0A6J5NKA7_9CAUD|nr:hypothetical protein UFOVP690_37 [uncultured Caudovirales phage]